MIPNDFTMSSMIYTTIGIKKQRNPYLYLTSCYVRLMVYMMTVLLKTTTEISCLLIPLEIHNRCVYVAF